jgi:hypothetical protein
MIRKKRSAFAVASSCFFFFFLPLILGSFERFKRRLDIPSTNKGHSLFFFFFFFFFFVDEKILNFVRFSKFAREKKGAYLIFDLEVFVFVLNFRERAPPPPPLPSRAKLEKESHELDYYFIKKFSRKKKKEEELSIKRSKKHVKCWSEFNHTTLRCFEYCQNVGEQVRRVLDRATDLLNDTLCSRRRRCIATFVGVCERIVATHTAPLHCQGPS